MSTPQGDSQLVSSSQGEVSCSDSDTSTLVYEEPGVELLTFLLPANQCVNVSGPYELTQQQEDAASLPNLV